MIRRFELVLRQKVELTFEEGRRKEERWSRDLEFMFIGDRMIICNASFLLSCDTGQLLLTSCRMRSDLGCRTAFCVDWSDNCRGFRSRPFDEIYSMSLHLSEYDFA
jgi:hypothetical protein